MWHVLGITVERVRNKEARVSVVCVLRLKQFLQFMSWSLFCPDVRRWRYCGDSEEHYRLIGFCGCCVERPTRR